MKKLMIALSVATIGAFALAQEGGIAPEAPVAEPATLVQAPAQAEVALGAPATETAQETQSAPEAAQPGAPKKAQPQQAGGFNLLGNPMMLMFIIFALFYFMMIRPQQRKEKERRNMINELKAGAKVVFSGGIIGKIVEANEKTFKVETAPGTEMEILRAAVQGAAE